MRSVTRRSPPDTWLLYRPDEAPRVYPDRLTPRGLPPDLHRRYRGYLETLSERSNEELRSDFAVMGGLRHYLLLAVETVLDLGSHVISSEGYEAPANHGALPERAADVDEERVRRILRESLGDLDAFVRILRERFLDELRE